jgi:cysteine desulfurase
MVYADYNATAPLRPEARAALQQAYDLGATNPSSVHSQGRKARRLVENARLQVGTALGTRPQDLIFTSGGTEALNLAIHGLAAALPKPPALIVSAIEHEAVSRSAAQAGRVVRPLPVTGSGLADLDALRAMLTAWDNTQSGAPVLCLMFANNETGVIQPVAEAARLMHEAGGLIVCDAVQAFGKIAVNVGLLGIDYLAVSAHKLGGPQGVGALWTAPGAPLRAWMQGGGQENGFRSGTENVAGICGFGAAAEAAVRDLPEYAALGARRDAMEERLEKEGGVRVMGKDAPRLAGTSNFARAGFRSETQVMALDIAGVCVSAGSACSSGKVKRSLVLGAMGVDDALAESAIRASFGWDSKPEDFDGLAEAWLVAARRLPDLQNS